MSKAEMTFAGVKTRLNKPGRKLTKSLFRQIVLEDIAQCGTPIKLDKRGGVRIQNVEIIGWVNYFWPGCEGKKYSYENCLHVLWKRNDEYRRTLISCYDDLADAIQKKDQIFLGDFCF